MAAFLCLPLLLLALLTPPVYGGETRFWVWDLTVMPPGVRYPEFSRGGSRSLAEGDRLHIWVEDGLREHAPTQSQLHALLSRYARDVDVQRGVYGRQPTPPSGDRDIHVLIAALPPFEKNGKKYGFDGFFNIFDQFTSAEAARHGQRSNERNIVYVNALQGVGTEYMQGVVAHELNHLITHGQYDLEKNAMEPWLNELLGEAAMQLTGHFTDQRHVEVYRQHPEWPLPVVGYGASYGGLSLLAEYLRRSYGEMALGRIAPAQGNGFERLRAASGVEWNELFADYARWLFEQNPPSNFPGPPVAIRQPAAEFYVGPGGVAYFPETFDTERLEITATPKGCVGSQNMLRTSVVQRSELRARALWVESAPPCAAERGSQGFEQDAFRIRNGY